MLTAEQFTLEHMDKLMRGMTLAREKLERLEKDLHHSQTDYAELMTASERDRLNLMEAEATAGLYETLATMVEDMVRGIRTADELAEWVGRHPA